MGRAQPPRGKYPFLPVARAAALSGLPVTGVRDLIKTGRVAAKDHMGVCYVSWASLMDQMESDVIKILGLRRDIVPDKELPLEQRNHLLYAHGYVPVPVAQEATSMTKVTIYRWLREGSSVKSIRVTNRIYVHWASLVHALGAYASIANLNPGVLPTLPPVLKTSRPRGPRLKAGSPQAKSLRRKGFVSVREAAKAVALDDKVVRRWVDDKRVESVRHGSSILVSQKSLEKYLQQVG